MNRKNKPHLVSKPKRVPKRKTGKGTERTEKKKKLIKLISENIGKKRPLTMKAMMLEAGYAKSTAEQQSLILLGVKADPEMIDVVARMIAIRDRALKALEERKLDKKTEITDLRLLISDFNKNIELLSGRPTGREVYELDEKDRKLLDRILYDNK